jgi:hypothetical protein
MRHVVKERNEVARRAYCLITNLQLNNLVRGHNYQKSILLLATSPLNGHLPHLTNQP